MGFSASRAEPPLAMSAATLADLLRQERRPTERLAWMATDWFVRVQITCTPDSEGTS